MPRREKAALHLCLTNVLKDNVLVDMVQRLRAIELLLRTQNDLLIRVVAELERIRRCAEVSHVGE
jgi:hypothetical protein